MRGKNEKIRFVSFSLSGIRVAESAGNTPPDRKYPVDDRSNSAGLVQDNIVLAGPVTILKPH